MARSSGGASFIFREAQRAEAASSHRARRRRGSRPDAAAHHPKIGWRVGASGLKAFRSSCQRTPFFLCFGVPIVEALELFAVCRAFASAREALYNSPGKQQFLENRCMNTKMARAVNISIFASFKNIHGILPISPTQHLNLPGAWRAAAASPPRAPTNLLTTFQSTSRLKILTFRLVQGSLFQKIHPPSFSQIHSKQRLSKNQSSPIAGSRVWEAKGGWF